MSAVSIFNSTNGKSACLTMSGGVRPCFNVRIGNRSNRNGTTVVTSFKINKAENISVTPTLGKQLFLYVGGESAWEIGLEGICLLSCNSGQHGFDDLVAWYSKENVHNKGKAMKLVLGNQVFKGYLYRLIIEAQDRVNNAFTFSAVFVGVRK